MCDTEGFQKDWDLTFVLLPILHGQGSPDPNEGLEGPQKLLEEIQLRWARHLVDPSLGFIRIPGLSLSLT